MHPSWDAHVICSSGAGRLRHEAGQVPTVIVVNVPRPSMVATILSPGFKKICGFRAKPTPAGVPVAMTSPGSKVMIDDKCSTIACTPKTICEVLDFSSVHR